MKQSIADIVRLTMKDAHENLEGTMKNVDNKIAHMAPNGKALPIAAAYAHAIISEDMCLNGFVFKTLPLASGDWNNKMGITHSHPQMDGDWDKNFSAWAKEVTVDLDKFRTYVNVVYKQTDDFLAKLSDEDLCEKTVDLTSWNMGHWPYLRFINRFLIAHIDNLTGEISAIKGLQGLKGYPF